MLTLTYHIEIEATQAQVWRVLTDLEQYRRWAKAFSPHSSFRGVWGQGEEMCFFDPDIGGTRAIIDVYQPELTMEYHYVDVLYVEEHTPLQAVIDHEVIDRWIGTQERYQLSNVEGGVVLTVTITTHGDFENMFNHGWQQALPMIKVLCESASR